MKPIRKLSAINGSCRRSQKSHLEYGTLEPRKLLAADVFVSEFLASNDSGIVDGNGNESDWIELYNAGDQPQNLAGWHLTDNPTEFDKWTFPTGAESVLAAGEYLVVFASGTGVQDPAGNLHTSFSLSASGDYLALARPDLTIVNEFGVNGLDFPRQFDDVSYGAGANGAAFFETPTPGTANGPEFAGVVGDTSFSVDRGYYTSAFNVAITTETPGATIYYTTDGSVPTQTNGTAYSSPINISSTTNLRAAAFRNGYIPTNVDTQTYIFGADVLTQSANPTGFPGGEDYAVDPDIALDSTYTNRLLAGLQDIPTLSLTSDIDDLFGSTGVYTNSLDDTLEVATSAEYILADGTTGFQIDAGLRIAGGASRQPDRSPKHSFSLRFRQEYGEGRLNYDLFEGSPVDSFNSLQLRAVYNNSIIHFNDDQRDRATLIRDQFIRDSLIAFGQDDGGRGSYTNLFINGLFWGVYNLHERADSAHYAEYNGGDPDDYDALNSGTAIDGNLDSWNALQAAAASGTWQQVQDRLDVDNLIDWTIIQEYGGNSDVFAGNNWRAAGGGSGGGKWKIYAWDSERTLEGVTDSLPGSLTDVTGLYDDLRNRFPEFRQRMEDRIQKHYFNGGALTEEAVAERWQARVDELDLAIIGETARWGDYRRDVRNTNGAELYERDVQWVAENERLLTEYFPARADNVISRYQSLGFFSTIDAPSYEVDGVAQSGGLISSGAELTFTADDTVYYTIDGSDPRLEGGGINPDAIAFDTATSTLTTPVFGEGSLWRYNDTGANLDNTNWQAISFNDTGADWTEDNGDFGFGDPDIETIINDVNQVTNYFRKTFNYTPGNFDSASFSLKRDDGVVVYLNGVEIFRNNLPSSGTIFSNTLAISAIPNAAEDLWLPPIDFDLSLLQPGNNTLAVEIHQNQPNSSDARFDGKLDFHEQVTGSSSNPLVLTRSTNVRSRTLSGTDWSPLHDATFAIPVSQSNLRISELHFNPADPTAAEVAAGFVDNDDFEFLEIYNPDIAGTINLSGVQLSNGVTFAFGDVDLLPGERAVVVEDVDAFMARYGDSARVLGQWSGSLNNGGEQITLLDSTLDEIVSFDYGDNDPWYNAADGHGFSIVLDDPANTPVDELGKYYSWRASTEFGGTPGAAAIDRSGVVVNEILAHSDGQQTDTIELFNPTSSNINVGGWYLSDEGDDLLKYQIPAATVIAAGGYLVFDESDFNLNGNGFALSSSEGDQVYLSQATGGVFVGLQDAVEFDATFAGESLGRLPNGTGRLTRLASTSFGSVNGDAEVGPLVISEINYHPDSPSAAALAIDPLLTDNDLEYIEIANPTSAAIDLTDWRIRGEADYDFVAGTSLPAGEAILVVSFDPTIAANAGKLAAFEAHYGVNSGINIVGALSASLSNSTGRVALQQPDSPDALGIIPHVVVDELVYDDLTPWPDADGSGLSLERDDLDANGNLASAWIAATPTPGAFESNFLLGDANLDGVVNFLDISPFILLLSSNTFLGQADVNQDGAVDFLDISPFIVLLSS